MVDVLVIGGGPCGLFASFYAGMRGLSCHIIDSLPQLGGQLTALYPEKYIYDMPGFPKILAKDLVKNFTDQAMLFNPGISLNVTANNIEKLDDGYNLILSDGTTIGCKCIILAAGIGSFQPTKLPLENDSKFLNNGLYYGVTNPEIFKDKKVHIVGGGDSALDWACHLHSIAEKVEIIHRRDVFKSHESTLEESEKLGIKKHLWQLPTKLIGEEKLTNIEVTHTQSKETRILDTDALIINIGFKSSLGPLLDWGLQIEKNSILVDEYCQTNLPGIFAVGDVAAYPHKIKLIATGTAEAALAICKIKTMIDGKARLFPGHSSDFKF